MSEDWLWTLIAAVFGAAIGSFLNVCIYRLPRGLSITSPPSSCPHCGRRLAWYENVPVAAWIVLRGRCRTCGGSISVRYMVVEALTAAAFGAATWYYGPGLLLASRLVLACALIMLFAIDLEHHLLPNVITLPGILVGLAFSFFAGSWVDSVLGILLGGGSLLAMFYAWLWLRKEEALGMGDPKMLAMIGAFLGWRMTLMTLIFGSFLGSVVGVGLIAFGRGHRKSMLPFGCFLAVGAAIAATWGPAILDWYMGLL
jgi:leader peptidase (prepilin peptidase)/N-methyltransferase